MSTCRNTAAWSDQGSLGVEDADGLVDKDSVVGLEFTLEDAGGDVRYRLVTGGHDQCNGTEEPRDLEGDFFIGGASPSFGFFASIIIKIMNAGFMTSRNMELSAIPRVPASEAEQIVATLKQRGTPASGPASRSSGTRTGPSAGGRSSCCRRRGRPTSWPSRVRIKCS